ncbi:MAG: SPOR domain-containing protein, partial [Gammaproteobacteria bacterium]
VAGVLPGDSGTRTLALPLPRAAAGQAVSTAVPQVATAFSRALPAPLAGHSDRFTSPWEQVPPAVAVMPNILPAPAAGGNSTRTNTGIILRHDPGASPLIPISATVPARNQDAAPAKQTDPAPALQVPPQQAPPAPALQAAPQQAAPAPALKVPPQQAAPAPALQAAPQQSASADKPVRPRPGRWSVVLGSYSSKKIARRMLAGFRDQGIAAELQTVNVDGATMHRVRVRGYRTKIAALTGADDLNRQPGIDGAWITKR